MTRKRMVGDRRCWPCTLANAVVGAVIALTPLTVMLLADNRSAVPAAAAWGAGVATYAGYRLVRRGYLPLASEVARRTGLHGRIGPEIRSDKKDRGEPREIPCQREDDGESE